MVRLIQKSVGSLLCLLALACDGGSHDPQGETPGGPGGGPAGDSVAGAPGQAGGTAGAGVPGGTGGSNPGGTDGPLPGRLRRLTNAEFDSSVKALLGVDSTYGASFTPDTRQEGFTRNDAQRVDPVFVTQLNDAAQKIAASAKARVNELAPCSMQGGNESCARTFVQNFAKKAYRRPATGREVDALMAVYRAGSEGAAYADGVEAVIVATLQSPGFLYLTELGDTQQPAPARMNHHEIASALSYLLIGAPPDDALLSAANAGELQEGSARVTQAKRLLGTQAASAQVVRMVHEWLGIDRITETAKDSNVYPEFAGLRDAMKREADQFVSELMWKSAGSVSELFAADWTLAEDGLARMYLGLSGGQSVPRNNGRVSLQSVRRRGILSQGAFLSVYAHATETAPVLRGVAVLRRIACATVPSPTTLNLNVVPPVPDPSKTTRERFTVHTQDAACASCHKSIDAVGFSFEKLDGMGRARQMENNRQVDSSTTLSSGYGFDGSFADSADLALKLATSPDVETCFAQRKRGAAGAVVATADARGSRT
ncbi:MAG TPA: DUF1592 domain-containing protein, partial [Polyangiales bacterium]